MFENVLEGDDVDLMKFPTPVWHQGDGGRYIGTGSYNVTQDPDSGWLNLGCYRIMIRDKASVTYNAAPGKHGRLHHEKYAALDRKMPVVMVLGGDPMTFFVAGSEAPDGISEFDVTGGIRGKPLELVRGKVTGLPFPANAEIVLEGYVHPETLVPEGPFGDWTGTYTEPGRMRPLTEVVAIYHRGDPIIWASRPRACPTSIPGSMRSPARRWCARTSPRPACPTSRRSGRMRSAARACCWGLPSSSAIPATPSKPATSPASARPAPMPGNG